MARDRIQYKSAEQMRIMARAGVVVEAALAAARGAAVAGASTREIDVAAHAVITGRGATSNFLGYYGFPAVSCISVNEEVVHGIPGAKVLSRGDVVSIDCGAIIEGWHGDSAVSFIVGGDDAGTAADRALVAATEKALWAGIAALATGDTLEDVAGAIEDVADEAGLHPLEGFVGHGIGTEMHQAPEVINYRTRGRKPQIRAGLCVAIEPMFVIGTGDSETLADDWTVVSADGSRAAHWEHSIAVHDDGIWVLTASDGGAAKLAAFGITPTPLP